MSSYPTLCKYAQNVRHSSGVSMDGENSPTLQEIVIQINENSQDEIAVKKLIDELLVRVRQTAELPEWLTELFVETEFCKQVDARFLQHHLNAFVALTTAAVKSQELWVSTLDRFWRRLARQHSVGFTCWLWCSRHVSGLTTARGRVLWRTRSTSC